MLLLADALVRTALREKLIVRALVWPELATALALVGAAAVAGALEARAKVAVADEAVAEALHHAGVGVVPAADPQAAIRAGRVARATWRDGDHWVLAVRQTGRASLSVEAAIRDAVRAPWRIEVPPPPARSADLSRVARVLVAMMAMLFVLFAGVFGVGSVVRARADASLEAEATLPVPLWVHGGARVLAGAGVTGGALACSTVLVHGLLGLEDLLGWCLQGGMACLFVAAAGVAAAGPGGEGFSGPISRVLSAVLGLLALGWLQPALGAWLPVAAFGALGRGAPASGLTVLPALLLFAWAARRFRPVGR